MLPDIHPTNQIVIIFAANKNRDLFNLVVQTQNWIYEQRMLNVLIVSCLLSVVKKIKRK